MIAVHLTASLPETILLNHRTAVLMQVGVSIFALYLLRWSQLSRITCRQCQTYYFPSVLVEQDEHRLDIRFYELESTITHRNSLKYVFFIFKLLTCGRCAAIAVIIMHPWLRICPSTICMPTCRQLSFLSFCQRHITSYLCHFGGQFILHRRIILPILLKGVDGLTSAIHSICWSFINLTISHQFHTAQRCSQNHVFRSIVGVTKTV